MTIETTSKEERVAALQRFGYNAREAAFLYLAATHSGYFLRRQYGTFLDQEDGGSVTQLVEKALDFGHATATTFRQKTQIYHLSARPFYARIGQQNNRNRRAKEPLTIKNRLMCLDFVLSNRDCRYLSTQQDKVEFFTKRMNVSVSDLPAKLYRSVNGCAVSASYFVDKYPVFLSSPDSSEVRFCFVDEGAVTSSKFETYLDQYGKLFSSLTFVSLIYVAATDRRFQRAQALFEQRAIGGFETQRNDAGNKRNARLAAYFELRRRYEAKQFGSLDRVQLIQLRDSREAFSGPEIEVLYERWTVQGDAALGHQKNQNLPIQNQRIGKFSTCVLPYSYELFGHVSTL